MEKVRLSGRKVMCSIANRRKWVRFPSQPEEKRRKKREGKENAEKKTRKSSRSE